MGGIGVHEVNLGYRIHFSFGVRVSWPFYDKDAIFAQFC